MAKEKDIHLWWLWDTPGKDGASPATRLKEVDECYALCQATKIPRAEMTVHLDDVTCPRCKIEASKQAA